MPTTKKTGRWKPGESGNPGGRKPGSGEVARLRSQIAKDMPEIITKLVAQAKGGDVSAARLLFERTVAPLKASEEPALVTLPDGTLTEQGQAVVAAVSIGDLTPTQGSSLLASLGTLAKLTECDELERRVADLESRNDAQRK